MQNRETSRHLGFYKFLPLAEPARLRAELRDFLCAHGLRGTVLVAHEGVNAGLAGSAEAIELCKEEFTRRFGALPFKEGPCDARAYTRLLVKVKRELIPVGDPALRPAKRTAPRISPSGLATLLDSGESVVLLDTRNAYEVEVGTFRHAEHLGLTCSRDFAAKARPRLGNWKHKKVVTFCTGGIRCEKASAWLLAEGCEQVLQLDGGILRFFEELGAASTRHFEGSCFVFDWREAVDPALEPVPRGADATATYGRHRNPDRPHSAG